MWTNPSIVYEVADPSAHIIKKESQRLSKAFFSSVPAIERIASDSLYTQRLSPFFLVGLLVGLRRVIDRDGAIASYEFLSLLHDHVGSIAQIARLLIQVVQAFTAALTECFARFFTGKNRGD